MRLLLIKKKYDILDVGTGPAPALMAFSIMHKFFNNDFLGNYVEQSQGFRSFLHRFCELFMLEEDNLNIPFHMGTFNNYKGIKFDEKWYERWTDDEENKKHVYHHTIKYRFDTIIFSNFLTTQEQTEKYYYELRKTLDSLRNNGLIIIVGSLNEKKYSPIYDFCDNLFKGNHTNSKFYVNVKKVIDKDIFYSFDDEFAEKIKDFDGWFLSELEKNIEIDKNQDWYNLILKRDNGLKKPIGWKFIVYKKKSKPRFAY